MTASANEQQPIQHAVCPSCGAKCAYANMPGKMPCSGRVMAADEIELDDGEYITIHLCEAHLEHILQG